MADKIRIVFGSDGMPIPMRVIDNEDGTWTEITSGGYSLPTFTASVNQAALPALATDIFQLQGSATKAIEVIRMEFLAFSTQATFIPVTFIRRSSANSPAGSAVTIAQKDPADPAPTALASFWTAVPAALGTKVAELHNDGVLAFNTVGQSAAAMAHLLQFGTHGEEAIVLRGLSDFLTVSLNATTVTGGKFSLSITWIEKKN